MKLIPASLSPLTTASTASLFKVIPSPDCVETCLVADPRARGFLHESSGSHARRCSYARLIDHGDLQRYPTAGAAPLLEQVLPN
jgi:hypothetical protein